MKIVLERFAFGETSTLGALYAMRDNGSRERLCWTLEDERRRTKVKGETCIPEGRYKVSLRKEGGFHQRYAKKYPAIHNGMLWVRDVPGFEWILLHIGNYESESDGCILLGSTAIMSPSCEFSVMQSEKAYLAVYHRLAPFAADGDLVLHVTERQPE